MKDKEKIRAEIERRRNIVNNSALQMKDVDKRNYYSEMVEEYDDILRFINSLSEEPVSEDLEEAAKTYAKKESHGYEPCNIVETFKAGAEWQKEQMFKDAVICVVEPRYNKEIGRYLSLGIVMNEQIYKAGDIVKLIIIKEGKQ